MWTLTANRLPPENSKVKTKIDDEHGVRNECTLLYHSNMWWAGEMYTYYQPTHWKHI